MAQRVRTDPVLFFTIIALVIFGLVAVYSASSVRGSELQNDPFYHLVRQARVAAIGIPLLMILKRRDYRTMNNPTWAFIAVGITIVLLIVAYFDDSRYHRWLTILGITFQPSELAKPALALFLAWFLTMRAKAISTKSTVMPAAAVIGAFAGLVVLGDFGTALVLVAGAAVAFLVAGLEKRYIAIASAVALVFLVVAIFTKPYRRARVVMTLDPQFKVVNWIDPSGELAQSIKQSAVVADPKYQPEQSLIALGSGGLAGRDLMKSRQKLFYLPVAHTDFILAIIGEELGVLGTAAVLCAFVAIGWRGLRLAATVPDSFGRYLALVITTMFVFQALLNITVVLAMVPTKGIPLPLISYGGSSLLCTLISLGMLLSVSDHAG